MRARARFMVPYWLGLSTICINWLGTQEKPEWFIIITCSHSSTLFRSQTGQRLYMVQVVGMTMHRYLVWIRLRTETQAFNCACF